MTTKPWVLPKMRDLSRYKRIILDTETSGLNPWQGHRPLGFGIGCVRDDGQVEVGYYPYGHDGGPQYGKLEVLGWLDKELRDKEITYHNATFDIWMSLAEGLDLRKHNNVTHDTMYRSILLNPNEYYTLDRSAELYAEGIPQKLKLDIPIEELAFYPSDRTGPYAEQDIFVTHLLDKGTEPLIAENDLEGIYRLECDCISPTVEMMNNGMPVDVEKLEQWITALKKKVNSLNKGLKGLNPRSPIEMKAAFTKEGIPYPHNFVCQPCSEKLKRAVAWPSFGQAVCPYCHKDMDRSSPHFGKKLLNQLNHPLIRKLRESKDYSGLLDGFLIPWAAQIKMGKILPFQLNQMRDKSFDGSTRGTVTGRYSCEMFEGGKHLQQVWSPKNQIAQGIPDFILRELFVSGNPGLKVGAIDASQIEYRLLAHFSQTDKIADEYNKNPFVDYHELVQLSILQGKVTRKQAKNINFGKIYGMGVNLFARQMEIPFHEAKELYDLYETMLPEAKETDQFYEQMARISGTIRTLRGRTFKFGPFDKTHVSMSRLIQGSAGDLMKEALIKLYRSNLFDKLRLTVHDEAVGDMDPANGQKMVELLNDVTGLRVPLRWQLDISDNWAMTDPNTIKIPTDDQKKLILAA